MFGKLQIKLELQIADIVNIDLQLLKAINKGHPKVVLNYIIVIMISTINNFVTNRWINKIKLIVII